MTDNTFYNYVTDDWQKMIVKLNDKKIEAVFNLETLTDRFYEAHKNEAIKIDYMIENIYNWLADRDSSYGLPDLMESTNDDILLTVITDCMFEYILNDGFKGVL